MATSQT